MCASTGSTSTSCGARWRCPPFLGDQAPLRVYVGRVHLLIAYRAADGLLQVAWVITKGTYGEVRRRSISEWVEEMAHHVTPNLGVHLRAHSRSLTHPFLLSAVSDRVTQWLVPGSQRLQAIPPRLLTTSCARVTDHQRGSRRSCARSSLVMVMSATGVALDGAKAHPYITLGGLKPRPTGTGVRAGR